MKNTKINSSTVRSPCKTLEQRTCLNNLRDVIGIKNHETDSKYNF